MAAGKIIDDNCQRECNMIRPHAAHTGSRPALAHNRREAATISGSEVA